MMYDNISNDRGLTLIEMIITIAISVILVSLAGLSLSVITGADTNKSAKAIESMLVRSKTECMGKADKGKITVHGDSGAGAKAKIGSGGFESIAPGRVKSYYTGLPASDPITNSGSMGALSGDVVIEFASDGSVKSVNGVTAQKSMMYEFAFKRGNRVDAVVLYASTGKTQYVSWFE